MTQPSAPTHSPLDSALLVESAAVLRERIAHLRENIASLDRHIATIQTGLDQVELDPHKPASVFRLYTHYLSQRDRYEKDLYRLLRLQEKHEQDSKKQPLENHDQEKNPNTQAGNPDTNPSTPIPQPWRQDPVVFAQEALGVELFDHQQRLCRSRSRVTLLIAGRGAGKSLAARVKALHAAVCHPHRRVLVVSSGQRMSSTFGAELLDLLRESPLNDWVKSLSKEEVQFHNGSTLNFLPANPDTIRGYHPLPAGRHSKNRGGQAGLTVILDEACFMEHGDEIRKAVEYTTITTQDSNGQLIIVSSPSTVNSWVYGYAQLAGDPKADTTVIQCGSRANPHISDEELERLKAGKNELEYRAEVLGEWVDGAYGLFSGLIEPNIIEVAPDAIPENAEFSLGADLALSFDAAHDRNALAVLAKYYPPDGAEPRYRLQELHLLDRAADREVQERLAALVKKYCIYTAAIEHYQGKALAEHCQRLGVETRLLAPTPGNQYMMFHEMHRLLRLGVLELPKHLPEAFFAELRAFEYRRGPNGQVSFGHSPGSHVNAPASKNHDDGVYAAAWALYAAQEIPPPTKKPDIPHMIRFVPKF